MVGYRHERATWFERTLLERQMVVFPPNVSFCGNVRRTDGSELSDEEVDLLKWIVSPVADATCEIMLPKPERFTTGTDRVSPQTVIHFSGLPNAATRLSDTGELEIHLGLLFTFWSLRSTFDMIERMITGADGRRTIEELSQFRPPRAVITEIDTLMNAWHTSRESGWRQSILIPTAKTSGIDHMHMDRGMAFLVVGHELTHWLETIYKEAEWTRMMNEAKGHLGTWLSEENAMVPPRAIESAKRLLDDSQVLDSWVREIHADNGAFDYLYACDTHGGWAESPQMLMHAYIHISFFFSLLSLFELFLESEGQEIDVTTHPPANVRRAVWCHVQAKRNRMSLGRFMTQQFGAGLAVWCMMDSVMHEYMKVSHGRFEQR